MHFNGHVLQLLFNTKHTCSLLFLHIQSIFGRENCSTIFDLLPASVTVKIKHFQCSKAMFKRFKNINVT